MTAITAVTLDPSTPLENCSDVALHVFLLMPTGADPEQNGRAGEPPECAGRGHDEPQGAS